MQKLPQYCFNFLQLLSCSQVFKKMKVLILILNIFINISWAQVDPILPPLPDSYSTNIQVNYQDTLRGDEAGVPIASEGQSFSLFEAVDDGLDPNFTRALLYYNLGNTNTLWLSKVEFQVLEVALSNGLNAI